MTAGGVELAPFPDVELLGPPLLGDIAHTDVDTPAELGEPDTDLPEWITFIRTGGGDDGITDRPIVEVTTYAPHRSRSSAISRAAAARILAAGCTRVGGVLIDTTGTYTGPLDQRDQNPDIRVIRSYYQFDLRRPR